MRMIILPAFLLLYAIALWCVFGSPSWVPSGRQRELHVSVLERSAKDGSVKPYVGLVEYYLATFCEEVARGKQIADGFSGPSEVTLSWYSDAECTHGLTRVKYALLVNWMRCVPASGIETADVRAGRPHLTITVDCDR